MTLRYRYIVLRYVNWIEVAHNKILWRDFVATHNFRSDDDAAVQKRQAKWTRETVMQYDIMSVMLEKLWLHKCINELCMNARVGTAAAIKGWHFATENRKSKLDLEPTV
jgi:hypothetical protein